MNHGLQIETLISAAAGTAQPPTERRSARVDERTAPASTPLGSVVIPAHNEASVIGRCLKSLLAGFNSGELDVVVACNGCSDDTAAIARSAPHSVRVIELDAPSKPAALRAGDAAASGMPRLYLDADVVLSGAAARRVLERLSAGAMAARPPIQYDSSRSSASVRSYYRARAHIPAVMGSLWGAGIYGLSGAGRARFGTFPDVVGDDLWLDRLFDAAEIEIVDCEPVLVAVPRRARDLVNVLQRTYAGKAELIEAGSGKDERARAITSSAVRDLRRLAGAGSAQALDAATYSTFAAGARLALALSNATGASVHVGRWRRDDTSRMT